MAAPASIKTLVGVPFLMAGLGLIPIGLGMAQTFTVLHPFNGNDGALPYQGVILFGSTLYGAAEYGGISGAGTIFRLNTDGTSFTNLYHFSPTSGPMSTNTDGANPAGKLVLFGNTLYGTATAGGSSGNGTVFAINTDGSSFTNLYSFTAHSALSPYTNSDGVYPQAGLILSGDTLYGVADGGGTSGTGTIFKLNTNGTSFTTLYNFSGGGGFINSDGAFPLAPLILSGNTLYGTTGGGGSSAGGVVFRINTDGTGFTNLHSFTMDAYNCNAGLIQSSNTLFGVTIAGRNGGDGAVFRINTDGTAFSNLYHFTGGKDGAYAGATLALNGNTLYGSTGLGGSSSNGVNFKVHTDGTGFGILHDFSAGTAGTNTDGANPYATMIFSGNMLYGSTGHGGSTGNGTIFSIYLLPELTITLSSENNAILSWPINYAEFTLQSTTNLVSPFWITNSQVPVLVNGQNTVTNPISGSQQFFRLSR